MDGFIVLQSPDNHVLSTIVLGLGSRALMHKTCLWTPASLNYDIVRIMISNRLI